MLLLTLIFYKYKATASSRLISINYVCEYEILSLSILKTV
jgi:hypothetical protein